MTDDSQGRPIVSPARSSGARRRRLQLALAALLVLLLTVIFVPPLFSVNRYKGRITGLIATSLGRPVRLSSVELRLFPRPGFVLSDLSVAEDPAYGVEPVVHADTVTASIRLLSLLTGHLEIGRISVDTASLNIVRSSPGHWNLDSLFQTAAVKAGSINGGSSSRRSVPLPYLEATASRINIKNGIEKLPFSLVNTDFEFWQPEPGEWRIRLSGQPARTDVSLNLEDTGIVRLEASVHHAAQLTQMPVSLDLDWRQAQLGQLARLVIGSDPGWRGDLTGALHLEGTAEAAQIKTQLAATNVHRAEFAPLEPLDFDANCSFTYHYSQRSLEGAVCDSPLGGGRIHLTGDLPSNAPPRMTAELDRIPVAAGLGALRTLRSGLAADLEAKGTISGSIAYATVSPGSKPQKPTKPAKGRHALPAPPPPGPLTGSLTVDGLELSGAGLTHPVQAPKTVLAAASDPDALSGTVTLPAGGAAPLTIGLRLALSGYQAVLHGPASVARARELAGAAGMASPAGLDGLAGDPIVVDLTAAGPWLPAQQNTPGSTVAAGAGPSNPSANPSTNPFSGFASPPTPPSADSLSGTVTLRNANWQAGFLAGHLDISQATLHLDGGALRWDPVVFAYGPLKGTATLDLPTGCAPPAPCVPNFDIQFGDLDAATVQTAILGAQEQGTLLSGLIDRIHPSSGPSWPRLEGTVKASSLVLGPVTLRAASGAIKIDPTGAEITDLDAQVLGGHLHVTGTLQRPANDQDKPAYAFEGQFDGLKAAAVGQLIGLRWSGAALDGQGKVELSGYLAKALAASARGTLHFESGRGAVAAPASAGPAPAPLAHFDRWTADAAIANSAITLGDNAVVQMGQKHAVEAALNFGDPPKVVFARPVDSQAAAAHARKPGSQRTE